MVSLLADRSKLKPQQPVNVHFLGTCSGGGPIVSRNCSSLAVDFGNDVWLFDVADGTLSRLHQSSLKMSNISRIFISHMHGDHVLGLVAVLKQIMTGVGMTEDQLEALRKQGDQKKAHIHIYGPPGVRQLIRLCLRLCSINLSGSYAVHELLEAGQEPSVPCLDEELPVNEAIGEDIVCDQDGVWRDVIPEGSGKGGRGWAVSAGPLEHRVPCRGYIITEPTPVLPLDTATLIPLLTSHKDALATMSPPILHPLSVLSRLTSLPPRPFTLPDGTVLQPPSPSGIAPRRLVVFGDCAGGTPNATFERMCAAGGGPSLLVHECTNAAIPAKLQKGEKGRRVRVNGLEHSMVKKVECQKGERLGQEGGGTGDTQNGAATGSGFGSGSGSNGHTASDDDQEAREREVEERKREETRKKAKSRGHSTPKEVGDFAAAINARRVVVNHFSAMFPSPRYPSTSPFPSILSPISPFPHPIPYPLLHSPDPHVPPHPLTEHELHLRIMMHNIVDQIDGAWTDATRRAVGDSDGAEGQAPDSGHCASAVTDAEADADSTGRGATAGRPRAIVPARDFMVLRIPSHELTDTEFDEVQSAMTEARRVTEQWKLSGGVWVDVAEPSSEGGQKKRSWVGYTTSPVNGE